MLYLFFDCCEAFELALLQHQALPEMPRLEQGSAELILMEIPHQSVMKGFGTLYPGSSLG